MTRSNFACRVGGTHEITCNATIIASSNRNLKQEVEANRFRGDLYHRLTIFPIALTPLRDEARRDDIRLLAEYFLETQSIYPEKAGTIKSFTNLAMEALETYAWPGNVRELKNVIDRAVLLETGEKISLSSIVIDPENPQSLYKQERREKIKDYSLARAEQELIARVLKETNWQKTKAAQLLGISRATLYAKVKQHNLPDGPDKSSAQDAGLSDALSEPHTIAS
jgi:DNA-binding NtrC family response regulator